MLALKTITRHYAALCSRVPLKPIRNEKEYCQAVAVLNELMDNGAGNERHPLADLLVIMGNLIATYEEERLQREQTTPAAVLRFLMDQHTLAQTQLPEVGSQGVVSELLAGKRKPNARQVQALCRRFGVSPAVFLERD